RQMVDLRPVGLDDGGLAMVLEDYVDQCRQDMDMTFDFQSRLTGDLPAEIQITLFRIAQEALANVRKHAVARHVEIRLDEVVEGVALRITDDGIGMASPMEKSPLGHLGLTGMRERAETAGGWCRVGGRPGAGTTVECWLPAHHLRHGPCRRQRLSRQGSDRRPHPGGDSRERPWPRGALW